MNLRKLVGLGVIVGTVVGTVGYIAGFESFEIIFINILLLAGLVMLFGEHLD